MALSPKQAEKLDQLAARSARLADGISSQDQSDTRLRLAGLDRDYCRHHGSRSCWGPSTSALVLSSSFMQCMAISMYASLPGIIKALIAILTISVGGGEGFTFQNPSPAIWGRWFDPSSHFLYSVAIVARPVHHLDAHPDRHGLFLCNQGRNAGRAWRWFSAGGPWWCWRERDSRRCSLEARQQGEISALSRGAQSTDQG